MKELERKARAKINLGLDVLRKRPDGYHDLRMIMQTVELHDLVRIERMAAPGIELAADSALIPADPSNLAWKAAKCMMDHCAVDGGVRLTLTKQIPVAAGLAGGSSDAAAVLTGMNELFELGLSREQLMKLGVKIGADVPYCIMGGTALAEGIGERLTPLPAPPACCVLLAKPDIDVSTGYVYGNLHADRLTWHPPIDEQIEALHRGSLKALAGAMGNVLETVTIAKYPVIDALKGEMIRMGAAGAMMSGSGPTVFGLFPDQAKAEAAYEALSGRTEAGTVCLTSLYQP